MSTLQKSKAGFVSCCSLWYVAVFAIATATGIFLFCMNICIAKNVEWQGLAVEKTCSIDGVKKIIVNSIGYGDVSVSIGEEEELTIKEAGLTLSDTPANLSAKLNWWGDVLTIKADQRYYYTSSDESSAASAIRNQKISIIMPRSYHGELECYTDNGDILIAADKLHKVLVKAGRGSVSFNLNYADETSIDVETGSINMSLLGGKKIYLHRNRNTETWTTEKIDIGTINESMIVKLEYGNSYQRQPTVITVASCPTVMKIESSFQDVILNIKQIPPIYKMGLFSAYGEIKQTLQSGKNIYEKDQKKSLSQNERKNAKQIDIIATHCNFEISDVQK